jgi:DNA-binding MarR family transcriptional regulator
MGDAANHNPFDHTDIDDVIHGRLRLGIMAYLSGASPAIFGELRDKVQATDGNLSTHLRKLEEAGYVRQEKSFVGRRPQTQIFLTDEGRSAWLAWIARMQELIGAESAVAS